MKEFYSILKERVATEDIIKLLQEGMELHYTKEKLIGETYEEWTLRKRLEFDNNNKNL